MSTQTGPGPRRKRRLLSPEEWEIFLEVTSQELTQADAARKWGVDTSVVISGAAARRLCDRPGLVASDLEFLERLPAHADEPERRIADLLPQTPFRLLTTTLGWATVCARHYGAAHGDPARWPTARRSTGHPG